MTALSNLFPAAASATASKIIGINGTYSEDKYVVDAQNLGAQWMRVEQWNDTPSYYANMPSLLAELSSHNIREFPLVNNYSVGWVTAADKTTWTNAVVHAATTYGAGGSYWQGKTDLGSPVIEVANEAYGNWYPWPNQSYLFPGEYAKMLKQAAIAVQSATGGKVRLIASVGADYLDTNDKTGGSGGTWKSWSDEMHRAVPDIENYLAGVADHPYGDIPSIGIGSSTDPNWSHQSLYAIHAKWGIPIYVTEVGQKGPLVGFDKQAAAMTYYFDELRNNSWEAAMFWYNQKDYSAYNAGGDNGWALIDVNDKRQLAWFEYQKQAKAMETVSSGVTGDVNGDGKVNITDLSLLLSHYGANYSAADFDGNSTVNSTDVAILVAHYKP